MWGRTAVHAKHWFSRTLKRFVGMSMNFDRAAKMKMRNLNRMFGVCLLMLWTVMFSGSARAESGAAAMGQYDPPPRWTRPAEWETYLDKADDIDVKVLGGSVTSKRTFYHHVWYFNRAWTPILFTPNNPISDYSPSGPYFKRNEDLYTAEATIPDFKSDSIAVGQIIEWTFRLRQPKDSPFTTKKRIVARLQKIASGEYRPVDYRWEDGHANWIKYDLIDPTVTSSTKGGNFSGRVTSYGDRNNVTVTMMYDSSGNRTGVRDHLGRQVLWFEYDDKGKLTLVRDAANRVVRYDWVNNKVYDPNGNAWSYVYVNKTPPPRGKWTLSDIEMDRQDQLVYSITHANGLLEKKTDPEGHEELFTYDFVNSLKELVDQDGTGFSRERSYDSKTKQQTVTTKTKAGLIQQQWYDKYGIPVREDINGNNIYKITTDKRVFTRTDRNGAETINTFDEFYKLLQRDYPDGTKVTYAYDSKYDNVTSKTNENGNTTYFTYDASGNLIRKTEAAGKPEQRITEYTVDQYGNVTSETVLGDTNTLLATTLYEYDDYGNVSRETDPEGHSTSYTYDIMGNVLTRTDARGKVWTYTYDLMGNMLSETDPLAHTTTYVYDKMGRKIQETDAQNHTTRFEYTLQGWLSKKTDALGGITSYEYNKDGLATKITDEEGKIRSFEYDAAGRLFSITDGNGSISRAEFSAEGGLGHGQLEQTDKIIYPTFERQFKYDTRGRVILDAAILNGVEGIVFHYAYDGVGNLISETDSNGKTTYFDYDGLNRLVKRTDAEGNATQYAYDKRNNLIALTDANTHTTRYAYDRNDRVTKETHPLGEAINFAYDATGNLVQRTDAKNQKVTYGYDAAGRRTTEAHYATSSSTTALKSIDYTYDEINRLSGWNDGAASGNYTYDIVNRLLAYSVNFGAFTRGHNYTYYKNGLRNTYTGPDGVTYTYAYDDSNRPVSVTLPGQGAITVNSYQWQAPTKITFPGGTTREMTYNGLLSPQSIVVKDPAQHVLSQLQYSYGKMQEILAKDTDTGNYSYTYNDAYRLTEAAQTVQPTEAFTLDAQGNRTAQDASASWSYNANDQLTARPGFTYEYDANLNLIKQTQTASGQVTTYGYDSLNRLVEVKAGTVTLATYGYDPFDQRLWKQTSAGTTYYHYSDDGLSAEFDGSGIITATYGYWPDGEWTTDPLFLKTSAGTFYYQNDHLGTPNKLISNTGAVVWAAYYKAFGEVLLDPSNSVTNNLRFAGQYFDAETNLHYNYRRYYDPAIGRYLSEDPLGLDGGLNRYAYVDADPVHNIDPTGECLLAGAAAGAAIGAITSIIYQSTANGCIDWGDVGKMALIGGVSGAVTCGVYKFLRYPPCGRNSFPGDTLVHTGTGLKAIEQISKGDQVLSLAEWNNEKSYQTVEEVIRNEKDYDLYTITLANGEAITATDGHPLFVPNQGWMDARLLKQGDHLYLQSQGTVRITNITTEHKHEVVYNLEVANNHTFFVGVEGVLAHNAKGCRIHFVQHNSRKKAFEASGQPKGTKAEKHNKPTSRGQREHFHDVRNRNIHHTYGKAGNKK